MRVYLGVDGGGTRTRAMLVSEAGECLATSEGASGNFYLLGEAQLHENLLRLLEPLFADRTALELRGACFGLAGLSANPQGIREIIQDVLPLSTRHLKVCGDAEIALSGSFAADPGIILIAGTGSICLGRGRAGELHRVGGWGAQFDDLGSAGWLGRHAVGAALLQYDGAREKSPLMREVFARLSLQDPEALLRRPAPSHSELAALADIVTTLAESGEACSTDLVERAIEDLGRMLLAMLRKTGPLPYILSGGLIEGSPYFRRRLEARAEQVAPELKRAARRFRPVAGAVLLARQESGDPVDESFRGRLEASLIEHNPDRDAH